MSMVVDEGRTIDTDTLGPPGPMPHAETAQSKGTTQLIHPHPEIGLNGIK